MAGFRADLRHAANMALISALTIEMRKDARDVRQRAAIEALRGLAEGLKAEDVDTARKQGSQEEEV